MKRTFITLLLTMGLMITSCSREDVQIVEISSLEENTTVTSITKTGIESPATTVSEIIIETETTEMNELILTIDGTQIPVSWEANESVDALKELCQESPLTIEMSMYGGFEQVGPIGQSLPRSDEQITTQSGDIVLYSGDQIVLFYGSNSWSYTKLGKMELSEDVLTSLLENGDIVIQLSV